MISFFEAVSKGRLGEDHVHIFKRKIFLQGKQPQRIIYQMNTVSKKTNLGRGKKTNDKK